METGLLLSFLGASVLLTIMPGPDIIFVLTESITKGRRNGIAVSVGLCSGIMIHTLAAITGLSIIIQQSAIAFSVLKYSGAAYLFYMAIMSGKEKNTSVLFEKNREEPKKSFLQLMRKGFFMNILNPKVALFFIAFLPQFLSTSGFNVTIQMLILGVLFMIQGILILVSVAILSGRLSKLVNNAKFWNTTKWSKVCVLTGLGVTLALSEK